MTIYFAGSITGGRDDQPIYEQIIGLLKNYGSVFTEHFGHATLTAAGESLSSRDIHDRDIDWLRRADVIVAEVTTVSLGVGYELGRAVEWGKRVICLYRPSEGKRLSGMISGSPGIQVIEYGAVADLHHVFDTLLRG